MPSAPPKRRIARIDSDPSVGIALHHLVEDFGLAGALFTDSREALDSVAAEEAEIVLGGHNASPINQVKVATQLRVDGWTGEIVFPGDDQEDVSIQDLERLQVTNTVEKWKVNETLPAAFRDLRKVLI